MNLLLDTHIALWCVTDDKRLPDEARQLVVDTSATIWVSVASLWEIAIKHAIKGKGGRGMPISGKAAAGYFDGAGFHIMPATAAHIFAVEELPPVHADPFDRLLVAQAYAEGMTLLTSDALVAQYPGDVRKV